MFASMKNDSCVAIGADQGRANVVINGGTVYAESSNGAAIGGRPSTYDSAHCFGCTLVNDVTPSFPKIKDDMIL